MDSNFIKEFLARDNPVTKPHLNFLNKNILDLSDFGTEIIGWYMEKEQGTDSSLPIILFLRSQIEILESIAKLINDSLVRSCNVFLRLLLETELSMLYILETDSDRRSRGIYLVGYLSKHETCHEARWRFRRTQASQGNFSKGQIF